MICRWVRRYEKVTHKPKAPSGRELPTKSGEGEHVTIKLVQIQSCAGSFRHASSATSLSEGGLHCDLKQDGVILKGFSEMEKLSRNATDEGAKAYGMRNRRTLIRRLRRHLPYLREGFKSSNPPLNINLHPGLRSVLAVRAKKEPTGVCRLWFIMDFWMKREAFLKR